MLPKYVLHRLHGHFLGRHCFNALVMFAKFFSLDGAIFQILEPKYGKVLDPPYTLLMFGIENWEG